MDQLTVLYNISMAFRFDKDLGNRTDGGQVSTDRLHEFQNRITKYYKKHIGDGRVMRRNDVRICFSNEYFVGFYQSWMHVT